MNNLKFTRNKKGISGVITAIILIAIAIVLVGVTYTIVLPIVEDSLKKSGDCSPDILNKIELNRINTCYDVAHKEMKVAINIQNITTDEIIISATIAGGDKESVPINQNRNSGRTHPIKMINGFGFASAIKPTAIEIMPVMGGTQCQVVDSISGIKNCPTA
jgi:flagellin-like protein